MKEKQNLIKRKRHKFINNFFTKIIRSNATEKRNSIFITKLNKKMRISKDLITVEEDFILKVSLDSPNKYYDYFWMILDGKNEDIISKEIYIEDIKVDDSLFEVKNYFLKLEFENMYKKCITD